MYDYDYSKLLGVMRQRGYTQGSLAQALGICETSLNFKLNNKRGFRQSEIVKTAELLGIPGDKIHEYFFVH